jgi:uncharacterized protein
MHDRPASAPKKRPLIALFTYGGGMRGLIPAHFMQKIEEATGLHMADMVDVFCGPSTGSILNAALNIPHPYEPLKPKFKARHMVRFYEREGAQIFPQDAFRSFRSLIHDFNNRTLKLRQLNTLMKNGHYDHANLGRALRALFGRTKLSESLSSLLIPVYNIDGTTTFPHHEMTREERAEKHGLMREGGHALWLSNAKFATNPTPPHDVALYDAVMGSTAAPTFFPCHYFLTRQGNAFREQEITAIDGSIFDNPCTTYMSMLRPLTPPDRELIMIVIGTGYANRSIRRDDWNRFGSLGVVDPENDMPLINIFFHAPETALHDAFMIEMGGRVMNFNKSLTEGPYKKDYPSVAIDDASPENLRKLKNFYEMMLEENRKQFDDMCELLVRNYDSKNAQTDDLAPSFADRLKQKLVSLTKPPEKA